MCQGQVLHSCKTMWRRPPLWTWGTNKARKGARLDLPKLEGIEVRAPARGQAIDALPFGVGGGVAQEKEAGLD
jgi:hypothetical protein